MGAGNRSKMAMLVFVAVFLLNAVAAAPTSGKELRSYEGYTFDTYVQEFGKKYAVEEQQQRKTAFEANLQTILKHNSEYASGMHEWYMAVNSFADMTTEEFSALRRTYVPYSASRWPSMSLA